MWSWSLPARSARPLKMARRTPATVCASPASATATSRPARRCPSSSWRFLPAPSATFAELEHVLRAYRNSPVVSDADGPPEASLPERGAEAIVDGEDVSTLLRQLSAQVSQNFGSIKRRLETLESGARGAGDGLASGGPRATPFLPAGVAMTAQNRARATLLSGSVGRIAAADGAGREGANRRSRRWSHSDGPSRCWRRARLGRSARM